MKGKLISVVIPAYNVEKYIAYCLSAVIDQTYQNLEIIVINDCSTDGTGRIVKSFLSIDDRIRYYENKENVGLSCTRNRGIELAKGDYIIFIDSDDIPEKRMLEELMNVMNSDEEIDIAIGRLHPFADNIELVGLLDEEKSINPADSDYIPAQATKEEIFGDVRTKNELSIYPVTDECILTDIKDKSQLIKHDPVTFVMQSNKLFKKAIFTSIRFPEHMVHEDVYVIYSEYLIARKIGYTNKAIYKYRVKREGSITATVTAKRTGDMLTAYQHMIATASTCNDTEFVNWAKRKTHEDFMYMYASCNKQEQAKLDEWAIDDEYIEYSKDEPLFTFREQLKFQLFFDKPHFISYILKKKKITKSKSENKK